MSIIGIQSVIEAFVIGLIIGIGWYVGVYICEQAFGVIKTINRRGSDD